MKDPFEVLKQKQQELIRIRKEVEALRMVARLLQDEATEKTAELGQVVEIS